MWQDFVLSIIGIIFTVSLIPQLIDVRKNNVMNSITCFVTSTGCFVIAYIDFTLNLPYASVISIITASLWGLMFYYSKPLVKLSNYIENVKYRCNLYFNSHKNHPNE
jgi:hypothetical protein